MTRAIELNGVAYQWPKRPVVVVCIDGGDPAYFERGLSDGILPNIRRFREHGFSAVAHGVMPSYTNPNNMSIVTGSPQSVHGISGNYFLDPETGHEHMMNDPVFLRSETLLEKFSAEGARVVAITAKDKLRRLLGRGLDFENGCINFSSEKSDTCTMKENGIENVLDLVGLPLPDVYSADLSAFVLEAGIKILERGGVDVMYLSLTDYIQHKYEPGTPEINDLYTRLDSAFGRLADAGAVVAITADHGMSDKSLPDGSPNVVYLKDVLDERFGDGATRVVLPITDPYVRHHGALGGFARVYCTDGTAPDEGIGLHRRLAGHRGRLRPGGSLPRVRPPTRPRGRCRRSIQRQHRNRKIGGRARPLGATGLPAPLARRTGRAVRAVHPVRASDRRLRATRGTRHHQQL